MEKIDHYDILIISSFFGTGCDIFYYAPTSKNCVFFSNNLNIKDEIISKGWKFEFINFELSNDQITGCPLPNNRLSYFTSPLVRQSIR